MPLEPLSLPLGRIERPGTTQGASSPKRTSSGRQGATRPLPPKGSLLLWLKLPDVALNKKSNDWRSTYFPRKRWMEEGKLAILSQWGSPLPRFTNGVAIQATLYLPRLMDWENLSARAYKWPLDLLVSVGVLPDDSPTYWTPSGYPKQVVVQSAQKRKSETPGAFYLRKRLVAGNLGVKLVLTPTEGTNILDG